MPFYNIIPTRNIGVSLSILTYSSEVELSVGNIVEIDIRNSIDYGLVIGQNKDYDKYLGPKDQESTKSVGQNPPEPLIEANKSQLSDPNNDILSKIKRITSIFPFSISNDQLTFIKLFSDNTFCSLNDIWDSVWKIFELLTKKQITELQNQKIEQEMQISQNSKSEQNDPNFDTKSKILDTSSPKTTNTTKITQKPLQTLSFELDSDVTVRIISIIRSIISELETPNEAFIEGNSCQLLILFPEKKYLSKIKSEVDDIFKKDSKLKQFCQNFVFEAKPNKNSKETIWTLLNNNVKNNQQETKSQNLSPRLQIIFGTRSAIFLPLPSLTHIILVDEGNSMYIQDQNSLYFDTRDAVFLMYKAFVANLTMISRLPSVRLHSFYPEKTLEYNVNTLSSGHQNPPNLKIMQYDKKSSKFGLFGWQIEQILKKDEEI
jgi:hypothetical protein